MSDPIDDRLRAYAERWREAQPPPPAGAVDRTRRRTPALLAAAAVALALGAAAVAALAGDGGGREVRTADRTGSEDAVVPWVDDPAPPQLPPTTTTTVAPTAPACRAEDLRASVGFVGGAMSKTSHQVRLHNVSASSCWLEGYPHAVNGISGVGRLDDYENGTFFPDPAPGAVAPGGDGLVILQTATACTAVPDPRRVYRQISILLPGGGLLSIPDLELDAVCGIGVSRLGLADVPRVGRVQPEPPPPAPGSLATLRAELAGLPDRAMAGSEVRFEVVLVNPTDVDVRLDPCPGYRIYVERAAVAHGLNCRTVTSIPAHGRVRYDMRVVVPADAPPGATKFGWDMLPWGGPGAFEPLEIETGGGRGGT